MCIGIPAKVLQVAGGKAKVEMPDGRRQTADIRLFPKLKAGYFVYVQNRFVVQKLRKKEALETLKLLKG